MTKYIDLNELSKIKAEYCSDTKNTSVRHALTNVGMNEVVSSLDDVSSSHFTFSLDIKTLPVCDQKRSGRCWIFSACTILREIVASKLNITSQFELSQNFISYYDKIEKYNYQMEGVIREILNGKEPSDRTMSYLLSGVSDGGQWDMFKALVKKYGIVPKSVFPETFQSNNTKLQTTLCDSIFRQFAVSAYKEKDKGIDRLEEIKAEYFKKIYSVITSCFGIPVEKFDFSYKDTKGDYHLERDLTPKSFFDKYVGDEIDEYVSIISAPTKDKEYYHLYTIDLVGNVIGGDEITHLNLPFERMEELIIKQLKDNKIVWFGSDVSYYLDRQDGVWSLEAFDYQSAFDADIAFPKEDMLDFKQSAMNHAMVITGVDLVDDKPTKWKIENSWGSTYGSSGYFVMSESFFSLFVYQAAIRKEYLNDRELEALKGEKTILPPWDPFGTLAD